MGLPTTPQDAAPAYDDVFSDHPVNQNGPSGSASAYAAVPQDDVELQAHHDHNSASPTQPETFVQTLAGALRPKPHVHCEQCDVQTMARERRENERHCCEMVAKTFIIGFICLMVLGIVVTTSMVKMNKHRHDD